MLGKVTAYDRVSPTFPAETPGRVWHTHYAQHLTDLRCSQSVQPDACDTDFDAVSTIRGELFFFKSRYVWRLRGGKLQAGYPALASRHWQGIPSSVDAAFEDPLGSIWFFQGKRDKSKFGAVERMRVCRMGKCKTQQVSGDPDILGSFEKRS